MRVKSYFKKYIVVKEKIDLLNPYWGYWFEKTYTKYEAGFWLMNFLSRATEIWKRVHPKKVNRRTRKKIREKSEIPFHFFQED